MEKERIRTIVTQDAEVDDQNSLRHFLLYTNEVEVKGIVQTSSIFHWIGVEGAQTPPPKDDTDFIEAKAYAPYDRPNRWTGTDWMFAEIDDYAKAYPNLKRISANYPTPEYLRSITKIGNIGYPGEMLAPTEGSELIRENILADDPRKLYIQVWGGCNTIARALLDIQNEYEGTDGWETLHKEISDKVVLTACGEQDTTYNDYIAQVWPGIRFVHSMFMGSYAYAWSTMPECESKDSLRAEFMKNILQGNGPLLENYATWMDGKYYEGETDENQFGADMHLQDNWWGQQFGIGPYVQYDFLSEGDSPTYFMLFDWGFRTLEDFTYGGVSGRYALNTEKKNAKGEQLNYWSPQQDGFTDRDGNTTQVDSMWPYVADIQHDFAARAAWCAADADDAVEMAPLLSVKEGVDRTAAPGETIAITAQAVGAKQAAEAQKDAGAKTADAAGAQAGAQAKTAAAAAMAADTQTAEGAQKIADYPVAVTARIYVEASTVSGAVLSAVSEADRAADTEALASGTAISGSAEAGAAAPAVAGGTVPAAAGDAGSNAAEDASDSVRTADTMFQVEIPASAKPGEKLHVILQAKNGGGFGLTHYQQVIITVE